MLNDPLPPNSDKEDNNRKLHRRTLQEPYTTTEWGIGRCPKSLKTSAFLRPGVKDSFSTGS